MRKLIYAINITLDGCCDHTKGMGDEEIHTYFAQLLREVDVLVYGRKTYQLMVPFWPDRAKLNPQAANTIDEFAQAFVGVGKIVVFSRTLNKAQGTNTRVVDTDLKEEILRLKQEPGKDMLLGGVDLPSQLMEMDLIDEYRIVVQPLIVGAGRRLFDGVPLSDQLPLQLVESKVLKAGHVVLRYLKQVN